MKANGAWHAECFGDRESEVVFIGVHLEKGRIIRELERALLTDAELAAGVDAWREFDDVFFDGEFFEAKEEEEQEEQEEQEDEDQESADCDKSFQEEKVALRARRVAASHTGAGAGMPKRKRARHDT